VSRFAVRAVPLQRGGRRLPCQVVRAPLGGPACAGRCRTAVCDPNGAALRSLLPFTMQARYRPWIHAQSSSRGSPCSGSATAMSAATPNRGPAAALRRGYYAGQCNADPSHPRDHIARTPLDTSVRTGMRHDLCVHCLASIAHIAPQLQMLPRRSRVHHSAARRPRPLPRLLLVSGSSAGGPKLACWPAPRLHPRVGSHSSPDLALLLPRVPCSHALHGGAEPYETGRAAAPAPRVSIGLAARSGPTEAQRLFLYDDARCRDC
jgi:hypothetical protein